METKGNDMQDQFTIRANDTANAPTGHNTWKFTIQLNGAFFANAMSETEALTKIIKHCQRAGVPADNVTWG